MLEIFILDLFILLYWLFKSTILSTYIQFIIQPKKTDKTSSYTMFNWTNVHGPIFREPVLDYICIYIQYTYITHYYTYIYLKIHTKLVNYRVTHKGGDIKMSLQWLPKLLKYNDLRCKIRILSFNGLLNDLTKK